ncbi:MAG: hypothetical protein ACM3ZC_01170 [Bacteroidota bacterium]
MPEPVSVETPGRRSPRILARAKPSLDSERPDGFEYEMFQRYLELLAACEHEPAGGIQEEE